MIITIASGKGGTGKTTVAVNLALSLDNVQLLDCDVEEPNAHLFLNPAITEKKAATIRVPKVDAAKCTSCGICAKFCAYHALAVIPSASGKKATVLIFEHMCHGCGTCALLCAAGAITETDKEIGAIERGFARHVSFAHGRLAIGEIMSPPVIRQVKELIDPSRTVIIDAPPGTSCPVIASLRGSDACVLVTEPTPFGLNDLILAVEVTRKLKIPFGVVINRSDIGDGAVRDYCGAERIPVLMEIPFDREIAVQYSNGVTIVDAFPAYRQAFKGLYEKIRGLIT
ncbi:MAG TPA: ATP-binding protein [bacterium]|nr:ATP-binding protein [bacterium]